MYQLVIVGGGNMGAALLTGLLAAGRLDLGATAVVEASAPRRKQLEELFPGLAVLDAVPACRQAVIAVKPPEVASVAAQVAAAGAVKLLSIAAGVSTASIASAGGVNIAVVRAMPNTPALVGEGVSAIAGGPGASDADLDWAEQILAAVGLVVRVDESLLDAVTALTGSGPAYLFLVAEALIEAGVDGGLTRPMAEAMTAQLFVGSAKLLAERGDAAALRSMVTSPGGTTAAGLRVLEERGVRTAFGSAVAAARARSAELGA